MSFKPIDYPFAFKADEVLEEVQEFCSKFESYLIGLRHYHRYYHSKCHSY